MNRDTKIALLERVTEILDNAKTVRSGDIKVRIRHDEVTTVSYAFEEFVVPENCQFTGEYCDRPTPCCECETYKIAKEEI